MYKKINKITKKNSKNKLKKTIRKREKKIRKKTKNYKRKYPKSKKKGGGETIGSCGENPKDIRIYISINAKKNNSDIKLYIELSVSYSDIESHLSEIEKKLQKFTVSTLRRRPTDDEKSKWENELEEKVPGAKSFLNKIALAKKEPTDTIYKKNWQKKPISELLNSIEGLLKSIKDMEDALEDDPKKKEDIDDLQIFLNKTSQIITNRLKVAVMNYNTLNQEKKGEEDKSIEGYFIRQWAGCSLSNMISQKGPITPEIWIYTLPYVSPNTIFPIDKSDNDFQTQYSQKRLTDIEWSPEDSDSESIDEIHIKYNGKTIKIKKQDFLIDKKYRWDGPFVKSGCMISYRNPDPFYNYRDPDYDSEETPGKTKPLFNARESMKKGVGNDKSEINRKRLWGFLVLLMKQNTYTQEGKTLKVDSQVKLE